MAVKRGLLGNIAPLAMMAGGAALAAGSGGTLSPWSIPMMTTGLGMMSGNQQQDQQADAQYAQNMQRSSEQRYAPWLGRAQTPWGQGPTENGLSGGMQGALSGMMLNQNLNSMTAQQKLIDAHTNNLERQAADYAKGSGIDLSKNTNTTLAPTSMMGGQPPQGKPTSAGAAWGGVSQQNPMQAMQQRPSGYGYNPSRSAYQ